MKIKFVAGFAPIVTNLEESRKFYGELLSVPIEFEEGSDYTATDDMDGMKHFGLWTLQGAAQSVFGQDEWPSDVPIPQGTIEFDVDDVAEAVAELKSKGATILQDTKIEPWGQTTAHLLSPEGLLIGITYTPWMRE
jgi:catechol 2,3-dioxygenase-like lactoylglutathione lyase family enzyme